MIAKSPATADELSVAIGTDPDATMRLLRAGITLKLATVTDQRSSPMPLLAILQQDLQ